MLRVLCVISNPASWTGGVLGGGEIRAVEILKKWYSWGIYVETLETSPSPSLMMGAAYKIDKVSWLLKGTSLIGILVDTWVICLTYLWKLRFMRQRFDVVIASTSNFTDLIPAWFASKLLKVPFVVVFQIERCSDSFLILYKMGREEGGGAASSLLRAISSLMVMKLVRTASIVLCLSKPIMEQLRKLGFPAERLRLTSMGLNHDKIDHTTANNQRYDGIFLGRVEWNKGVSDLLEAWKIVSQKRPDANLLIAGVGDFLDEAREYVKKVGMNSNVKFAGFVSGKEKYALLKSGRIFLYPSRIKEGWGLAIAEALACELPVVCSENSVFLSVFGNCKGVFFVPVGDVERLAGVILSLLEDKAFLRSCREISKAYSQQYDWEIVAKRDLAVVENICTNR